MSNSKTKQKKHSGCLLLISMNQTLTKQTSRCAQQGRKSLDRKTSMQSHQRALKRALKSLLLCKMPFLFQSLSPAGRRSPPGYPMLLATWHSDLGSDPGTGSEAAAALGSSPRHLANCPQSCCLIDSCSVTPIIIGLSSRVLNYVCRCHGKTCVV